MSKLKIALIGECMVELQQRATGLNKGFGGDTLNTAVYLSRLTQGHDVTVSYVTGLGQDSISQEMLSHWQKEGIDTHLVQNLADKLPGLYMVETDEEGERSFLYWRNDSAAKYWLNHADQSVLDELAGYDAIYLSGISLAILSADSLELLFSVLEKCQQAGGKILFDNNYRPQLWQSKEQAAAVYRRLLALTHTALLTFDDEQAVYGDTDVSQCISRTQALGVAEIIIKQGGKECLVVVGNEQQNVAATAVAKVVDTNAAGDSFAAGFMSKRLLGADVISAAHKAHQVAGTVIQHQGAIIDAKYISALVD
ncbi:sugar kinase [Motilimonas pumila]|uniref:2-dehydro-3-deoxygluconokinase n=1 Tax=Motilimonas pumila TaxID=2303987 RepID=A0A418YHT3_9GAMM|nr:sugar kinase [Motilimonas pumila]RJG49933.1 sugar kinase [Motilimonas pumila]